MYPGKKRMERRVTNSILVPLETPVILPLPWIITGQNKGSNYVTTFYNSEISKPKQVLVKSILRFMDLTSPLSLYLRYTIQDPLF